MGKIVFFLSITTIVVTHVVVIIANNNKRIENKIKNTYQNIMTDITIMIISVNISTVMKILLTLIQVIKEKKLSENSKTGEQDRSGKHAILLSGDLSKYKINIK